MKKTTMIAALVALSIPKAKAELMAANVPDDLVDPEQTLIDEAIDEARDTQKDLMKNDKDFVGELKKGQYAIASQQYLSKVKKLIPELTPEDTKDKTTDEVLHIAVQKLRAKGDAGTQAIQEENVKLASELKKLREEEIPAIEGRVDSFKQSITIEHKLNKMVAELPKKLRVGAKAAIATLKEQLAEKKISVGLDAEGELEFYTGTPDAKLKIKNTAGTGFLTPVELVTSTLDAEKLLEQSGAPATTTTATTTTVTAGGKDDEVKAELHRRFPHLAKAEAHKDEIKEQFKKPAQP